MSLDVTIRAWTFMLLLIILLLSWFFGSDLKWTWFPEAIVAFGTLFLAIATFKLAQTSKEENAKLIAENQRLAEVNQRVHEQDKERDSKRRRLDEIKNWTEGVAGLSMVGGSSAATQHVAAQERSDRLGKLLASEAYIISEAKLLDMDIKIIEQKEENVITTEGLVKELLGFLQQWNLNVWGDSKSRDEVKNKSEVILKIVSDLRAKMKL